MSHWSAILLYPDIAFSIENVGDAYSSRAGGDLPVRIGVVLNQCGFARPLPSDTAMGWRKMCYADLGDCRANARQGSRSCEPFLPTPTANERVRHSCRTETASYIMSPRVEIRSDDRVWPPEKQDLEHALPHRYDRNVGITAR